MSVLEFKVWNIYCFVEKFHRLSATINDSGTEMNLVSDTTIVPWNCQWIRSSIIPQYSTAKRKFSLAGRYGLSASSCCWEHVWSITVSLEILLQCRFYTRIKGKLRIYTNGFIKIYNVLSSIHVMHAFRQSLQRINISCLSRPRDGQFSSAIPMHTSSLTLAQLAFFRRLLLDNYSS